MPATFIGTGSAGCVYKGIPCNGNQWPTEVVTKLFRDKDEYEAEMRLAKDLLKLLPKTKPPFVVSLVNHCTEPISVLLPEIEECPWKLEAGSKSADFYKIDYENGGRSLMDLVHDSTLAYEEKIKTGLDIWVAARPLMEGVWLMGGEDNMVIHGDIKPENIVYRQSDQRLFLIDWGGATVGENRNQKGTVGYLPPEIYMGTVNADTEITKNHNMDLLLGCIKFYKGLARDESFLQWLNNYEENTVTFYDAHYRKAIRVLDQEKLNKTSDTYSLGLTLQYVLRVSKVVLHCFSPGAGPPRRMWMENVIRLLLQMSHVDPTQRPTAEAAYKSYLSLCNYPAEEREGYTRARCSRCHRRRRLPT